ncbi:hypothetical protein HOLleu_33202 [Holothuria leucospilota]|uniref:Sulfotransferase n=1 Tax=Holothuria leucospilota TaxID=206669 RepID=A0A9Q0YSB0_HOLLE|nr:hypothetical protein HOLleu_33202 [Holothuria leucospilota]
MAEETKQKLIFLWSWPRSISTAFEKCLSFVDGVQIWHEPYTVAQFSDPTKYVQTESDVSQGTRALIDYLKMMNSIEKERNEFSNSKLMSTASFIYQFVKSGLEQGEPGKKYILIKDMAPAILDRFDALPNVPTRHTFVIRLSRFANFERNPADFDMCASSPVKEYFQRDAMHRIWRNVQDSGRDPHSVIVDAEDIMNHPEKILPKYLSALGIPFDKKYLTWNASESILQTWKGALGQILVGKRSLAFDKAFKSSRFLPSPHPPPTRQELTPDVISIVDRLMPGYTEMYEHRLKPEL